MDAFWQLENLKGASAGRWLVEPTDPHAVADGLTTDTRELKRGQAFLALRGERFDGHGFLTQAKAAGAAVLIVDAAADVDVDALGPTPVLAVDDTLAALQGLASAYRDAMAAAGVRVIAITGSNGKTSTRELLYSLLSQAMPGRRSPKSFNNHIGVPLTLLAARPGERFVVAEVGTNHPGEIEALARIVRPNAAVITTIGRGHIGHFGSVEAIAKEKAALLGHVQSGGLAVTPADEPAAGLLAAAVAGLPGDVARAAVGRSPGASVRVTNESPTAGGLAFNLSIEKETWPLRLPLVGRHQAHNAAVAAAVARWMGLGRGQIEAGLASAAGAPMRMQVEQLGGPDRPVVLINDAYNANPDSMAAAVAALSEHPLPIKGGRRVAILGEMGELGELGPQLHRELGALIAQRPGIDLAVLVGRLSLFTAEALERQWGPNRVVALPEWDASLPQRVAELVHPGDVVLIKASRAAALERLVEPLREAIVLKDPASVKKGF